MNNLDRFSIIAKLEMLNRLVNKDIENAKESIEHWESRTKEFGEDAVIHSNVTYKDALNRSIGSVNFYEGIINENNRLINLLEEELNQSEEYRLINALEKELNRSEE
jgi:hypothetical protein